MSNCQPLAIWMLVIVGFFFQLLLCLFFCFSFFFPFTLLFAFTMISVTYYRVCLPSSNIIHIYMKRFEPKRAMYRMCHSGRNAIEVICIYLFIFFWKKKNTLFLEIILCYKSIVRAFCFTNPDFSGIYCVYASAKKKKNKHSILVLFT